MMTNGKPFYKMTSTEETGSRNSSDYRVFFRNDVGPISPFHDINLWFKFEEKLVNMVVEIPRWTNAKMEISMTEPLNPIKQEVIGDELRYVKNCFPYHGIPWNYGALPQTWEGVDETDPITGYKGDGEPIDAIEIGQRIPKLGEVIQVKILGAFAVVDRKRTDWKLLVIDVNDENADQLNDVEDVKKLFLGILESTKEWFRIYRHIDKKPEIEYGIEGEVVGHQVALNVITNVHNNWKRLIHKKESTSGVSCLNVTVSNSPFKITEASAQIILDKLPSTRKSQFVDPLVDKWYFM